MKVALIGAGGKMGVRLAVNLARFAVRCCACRGQRGRALAPEGGDRRRLRLRGGSVAWSRRSGPGGTRYCDRKGRLGSRPQGRARDDHRDPRRRGALCRPPAGAGRRHLFRHPPLPSADLQRRDHGRGATRPLRRRCRQAGDRECADARSGGALSGRRGNRQDHLAADPAVAPRDRRADGDTRARSLGDGLRDTSRRHEGGARRGGATRRRPHHAPATS